MDIVYDLSRLTRRVRDMVDFVEDVVERFRIKLVSIRESIDTSTPSGKAFINIAAVFSQMYRDEIARTLGTPVEPEYQRAAVNFAVVLPRGANG
jgi:DNA invertase Pin-like site-specific DNA recombinase